MTKMINARNIAHTPGKLKILCWSALIGLTQGSQVA